MIYKKLPKKFNPRFEIASCYMEHKGEILLLHRHENKSEGDKWGVPAGKLDKGEDEMIAVAREIKEETGQEINPSKLEYLSKVYVKYPKYHFVYHMFHTKLEEKPLITLSSSEHKNYKWLTPKKALKTNLVRDLDRCIKIYYGN